MGGVLVCGGEPIATRRLHWGIAWVGCIAGSVGSGLAPGDHIGESLCGVWGCFPPVQAVVLAFGSGILPLRRSAGGLLAGHENRRTGDSVARDGNRGGDFGPSAVGYGHPTTDGLVRKGMTRRALSARQTLPSFGT